PANSPSASAESSIAEDDSRQASRICPAQSPLRASIYPVEAPMGWWAMTTFLSVLISRLINLNLASDHDDRLVVRQRQRPTSRFFCFRSPGNATRGGGSSPATTDVRELLIRHDGRIGVGIQCLQSSMLGTYAVDEADHQTAKGRDDARDYGNDRP